MLNRRCFVTVIGALSMPSWAGGVQAQEAKLRLAIVVAKNSPLRQLSIKDLRNLFKGDALTGPDGKRLIPLGRPPGSVERIAFDRAVLGMSPDLATAYWIDRKIRGQSGPPRSMESAELLLRVIAKLEGAVGYVRVNGLTDWVTSVRIEGRAPADADYPIQY
jgi:hypothetical protein